MSVEVDALDVVGNKGYAEYRLGAVFSGPLMVDGETVVEPHGQRIEIGAAIVAEFTDGKISAFRNYFDDAALLEQLLIA